MGNLFLHRALVQVQKKFDDFALTILACRRNRFPTVPPSFVWAHRRPSMLGGMAEEARVHDCTSSQKSTLGLNIYNDSECERFLRAAQDFTEKSNEQRRLQLSMVCQRGMEVELPSLSQC